LDALSVLLDACHYARGKFERCAAGGAIDRAAPCACVPLLQRIPAPHATAQPLAPEVFVPELGLRSEFAVLTDKVDIATRAWNRGGAWRM